MIDNKIKINKVITIVLIILMTNNVFARANIISPYKYVDDLLNATDNEISAINALNGNYVCALNDPYQQRYFKANIVKHLNKHVNTITIGSSHFLSLSKNNSDIDYYNLAIGAANLKDRLNILGLIELYDVSFDNLIFEIDIPSFIDIAMTESKDYAVFNKYGDYFYKLINEITIATKPELDFNETYVNKFAEYSFWDLKKVYNNFDLPNGTIYYKPDASQYGYSKEFIKETVTTEEFNLQHTSLIKETNRLSTLHINEEYKEIVEKIINHYIKRNVNITLVITPRPPYLFDDCKMANFPLVYEINEFVISLISKYNCKLIGSFNPHDLGLNENDFMDWLHLEPKVVNEIYWKIQ